MSAPRDKGGEASRVLWKAWALRVAVTLGTAGLVAICPLLPWEPARLICVAVAHELRSGHIPPPPLAEVP